MIEVHVTHEWKGFEVSGEPEKTWGIQMFGIRWDEAVNTINPDTLRKDWGDDLENVWPGAEQTLHKRLEDFLFCIQEVQAVLDSVYLASGAEQPAIHVGV
jgi:hypothetical protein